MGLAEIYKLEKILKTVSGFKEGTKLDEKTIEGMKKELDELVKKEAATKEAETKAAAEAKAAAVEASSIADCIASRMLADDEFRKKYMKDPKGVIKCILEEKKGG